jgi:hypothetical protein
LPELIDKFANGSLLKMLDQSVHDDTGRTAVAKRLTAVTGYRSPD